MSVRTISLEDQGPPLNQKCEHTMHGSKGWRKRGYMNIQVGRWSRQCTNRANGKVGRKWVCSAHGGPK